MSSYLGRAGTVGLGKAVEVLDTLGSSMTSLHLSSAFVSATTTKGNKISILAFEVANTVVKGANLMQSLSKENIKHLKEEVLPSEGVLHLISKDMDELLRIAAADKRFTVGGIHSFCSDSIAENYLIFNFNNFKWIFILIRFYLVCMSHLITVDALFNAFFLFNKGLASDVVLTGKN